MAFKSYQIMVLMVVVISSTFLSEPVQSFSQADDNIDYWSLLEDLDDLSADNTFDGELEKRQADDDGFNEDDKPGLIFDEVIRERKYPYVYGNLTLRVGKTNGYYVSAISFESNLRNHMDLMRVVQRFATTVNRP